MPGDKLRFRFAKTGTLRLLSHHDLMRCLERMLRRAALPFKTTAGFHPTPRVVFALPLPLGVVGLDEVVEIEFLTARDEDETLAALRDQAPAGLDFTRVSVIPARATARPRRAVYRLAVPPDRRDRIAANCQRLLAEAQVWVGRLKPSPKMLNIRPYLRGLAVAEDRLTMDLWVTQTGTARPDELLRLLGASDVVEAGGVVERVTVELRDEVVAGDPNDQPPDGLAQTRPYETPLSSVHPDEDTDEDHATADRGPIPAGPVVE